MISYLNIPLYDRMAPITAAADGFDMAARYCDALERCRPRIAEVFETIAAADPGAVLFHCTAGKDRTGIVAALLLTACGVPRPAVAEDYALTASVARPLLERLRGRALARGIAATEVDSVLASDAAAMRLMLERLEAGHGGIGAYLASTGLSGLTIERVKRRLLP
jgi:protein-tyrosine phosphatase